MLSLKKKKRSINKRKLEFIQFDFWVQGTTDPELREKIQKSYDNWRYNLYEVIEDGVKKGEFRADRIEQVPALTVSLLMGGSAQYLIDDSAFVLDSYLAAAEEMIYSYLRSDRG